jgi:hypothetical protein
MLEKFENMVGASIKYAVYLGAFVKILQFALETLHPLVTKEEKKPVENE